MYHKNATGIKADAGLMSHIFPILYIYISHICSILRVNWMEDVFLSLWGVGCGTN